MSFASYDATIAAANVGPVSPVASTWTNFGPSVGPVTVAGAGGKLRATCVFSGVSSGGATTTDMRIEISGPGGPYDGGSWSLLTRGMAEIALSGLEAGSYSAQAQIFMVGGSSPSFQCACATLVSGAIGAEFTVTLEAFG